jgi:signal transduction histidine kinase
MAASSPLHNLLEPLCLSGIVTWAAVASSMLGHRNTDQRLLIAVLLLAFLASFVACMLCENSRPRLHLPLVALQALIGIFICMLDREGFAPVLLVIAMAQLATRIPGRVFAFVLVVLNAILYLIFREIWRSEAALTLTFVYAGFEVFAATTAIYAQRAESARDELAQVNAHLLATHSLLEESARDRERLRLARELHDVAGHKLTALKLQLALLARDPAGAPPAVLTAATLADELLGDIRGVVSQMRQNDGLDLRRAIEELAAPIPRPKVHLDLAADCRVDDLGQAQALLRVAQEGLTNAARHSFAENVWLRLARDGDRLLLEIRDDGRGARNLRIGNGISGMCERLEGIGGGIEFDCAKGFRLNAWVPAA